MVFTNLTPQLSFSLQTTFTCSKPASTEGTDDDKVKNEDDILDGNWEEWRLPLSKKRNSYDSFGGNSLTHRGNARLMIQRESNLPTHQRTQVKHYLDPAALAPSLSTAAISKTAPLAATSHLRSVGQEIRQEDISELKQSRYDLYSSGRSYQPRCMKIHHGGDRACWSKNNGGGEKHAAKLWQRMEEEARGDGVLEDTIPLLKDEGQTVYSIPPSEFLI